MQVINVIADGDFLTFMAFDTTILSVDDDPTNLQLSNDGVSWDDPSDITQGSATSIIISAAGESPVYAFWRITGPMPGITFAGGKQLAASTGNVS